MQIRRSLLGSLILVFVLSISFVAISGDEFSVDDVVKMLEKAEKMVQAGDTQSGIETLNAAASAINRKIAELGGTSNIYQLEEQVSNLQSEVNAIKSGEGDGSEDQLKIGYVSVTEAFKVFTDAVQKERDKVTKLKDQLLDLRTRALQGEINEEEYKQQNDILQAERLRAQFEIELAMIEEMMNAGGFTSLTEKLRELRDQVRPTVDQLEKMLLNMRENSAIPEEVSQILTQANSQYEQLDSLLSNLIQSKIVQVTNERAKQLGYDLVLREQNVVLASNRESIDNLTESTKEALRQQLNPRD